MKITVRIPLLFGFLVCGNISCTASADISINRQINIDSSLNIEISNIRSQKGQVFIFLYNYENQYPYNPFRHFKVSKAEYASGKITFSVPDLPYGHYVVALLDDENGNENLDKILGLPKEGYGFSNNIRPSIVGLPKYKRLQFSYSKKNRKLELKMRYFL